VSYIGKDTEMRNTMSSAHDRFSEQYDNLLKKADCYLADVLFGMSYEFVKTGNRLLDVGIGTGMSSALFNRAGLRVFGIDGSPKMLAVCRKKRIAEELLWQDIAATPWPYPDRVFDHVISCGVFHFLGDLGNLFAEIARVHGDSGILAFTFMTADGARPEGTAYEHRMEGGLDVFSHWSGYIRSLLRRHHYRCEKEVVALVGNKRFTTMVARRQMP